MRASQLGTLEKQDRQAHLVTATPPLSAGAHLSTLTMMVASLKKTRLALPIVSFLESLDLRRAAVVV